MELKEMTMKEFNEINRRFAGYHWGKKQALVKEFLDGGAEVMEVFNFGQSPQNFRVGFDRAAKSLNAPVRTTVHGNRVFLVRIYDPNRD